MKYSETRSTLAELYHMATRNLSVYKKNLSGYAMHFEPHIRKMVSEAPKQYVGKDKTELLVSKTMQLTPLEEIIIKRQSIRNFAHSPLSFDHLAKILRYSCSIIDSVTDSTNLKSYKRTYPNSGNLGSIEIYPIILNVEKITPGIYHFDTVQHHLTLLQKGRFDMWLRNHVMFQNEFCSAAVVLILTASLGRLMAKYGQRGYRLGFLDAGHVSQNIYLLATSYNLAVSASAGFIDEELENALKIDGLSESCILTIMLGNKEMPYNEKNKFCAIINTRSNRVKAIWNVSLSNTILLRPTDLDILLIQKEIITHPKNNLFDVFLIGSFLEKTAWANDLDILVVRKHKRQVSLLDLEEFILHIHCFGLEKLKVFVDITFRTISDVELRERSLENKRFISWKIDSPKWSKLLIEPEKVLGTYKRTGNILVLINKTLSETSYYEKLPVINKQRTLRKAIPLFEYVQKKIKI